MRSHRTATGTSLALLVTLAGVAGVASAAEIVRGPYLQSAAPNAITVRWRTDVASDSRVWVGATPDFYIPAASGTALTTEHEVRLSGLSPGTTYYYAVGSSAGRLPADATWRFVTSPESHVVRPTRIWVLGDPGAPTGAQTRVREAYLDHTEGRTTDVWILLGDNAYENGTDSEFQRALFDPFAEFLRGHCVWATRGNHDDPHGGPFDDYYELFTLPQAGECGGVPSGTEAWYSFDHGDIHFIALDSQESARDPGSPMLTWLEADLAATTRRWIIAFWHHPPYSKGSHDSDDDTRMTEMRENVMPILEARGVDLVLAGHSHAYERSYLIDGHYGSSGTLQSSMILDDGDGNPFGDGDYRKAMGTPRPHDGEVLIVTGAASSLATGPLDHPVMAQSVAAFGSVVIDINGHLLEAIYLDDHGTVRDRFAINKAAFADGGPGGDVAFALAATSPAHGPPIELRYALPGPGAASVSIVDVAGRRLRSLPIEDGAGARTGVVHWTARDEDGRAVDPGIYFARLDFAGDHRSTRIVLIH